MYSKRIRSVNSRQVKLESNLCMLSRQIGFLFIRLSVYCGSMANVACTYLSTGQANADDVALGGLDLTEQEALLLIGDPAGLLRVVRFRLIDTLLLERHEQVRGGILILLIGNWLRHVDVLLREGLQTRFLFSAQLLSCTDTK